LEFGDILQKLSLASQKEIETVVKECDNIVAPSDLPSIFFK